ncbi:MAG: YaaL family protein [Clostridiales bacterium]|nr:YaaL family protein [Clostridiales bacterium]
MKNYLLSIFGSNKLDEKPVDNKRVDNKRHNEENQELIDSVRAAKEEWHAAQIYFENVSEPDLVDFSIYKLEAARRKYMYLLKLARNEGAEDRRILEGNNDIALS